MLLRKLTNGIIILLSFLSNAQAIPTLGKYNLVEGPVELCESFELKPAAKFLKISERYVFPLRNSSTIVQSDIDPACSFVEKIQKRQNDSSLFLVRSNQEICQEKVQTSTSSSVRLERDQITLWQVLDTDVSFTCQWKLQAK